MAGEPSTPVRARDRGRVVMLVVACFLLGAIGAAGTAYETGIVGGRALRPPLEVEVARANEALIHQRWDSPPGNNVRDITHEGLTRWPNEPQLLRIRTLACGDIMKAAHARREDGELAEALRLASLAYGLDPSDGQAQKLVAELETQTQAPSTESVPPLAGMGSQRSTATSPFMGSRAVIELSSARPVAGQPVDLTAHVDRAGNGAPPKVDGATFRVRGPGMTSGVALAATATGDGTCAFRATFSFPQGGQFEIAFDARADGLPVRSGRSVVVNDPKSPQPAAAASASTSPPSASVTVGPTPSTPPVSSAKWL